MTFLATLTPEERRHTANRLLSFAEQSFRFAADAADTPIPRALARDYWLGAAELVALCRQLGCLEVQLPEDGPSHATAHPD